MTRYWFIKRSVYRCRPFSFRNKRSRISISDVTTDQLCQLLPTTSKYYHFCCHKEQKIFASLIYMSRHETKMRKCEILANYSSKREVMVQENFKGDRTVGVKIASFRACNYVRSVEDSMWFGANQTGNLRNRFGLVSLARVDRWLEMLFRTQTGMFV